MSRDSRLQNKKPDKPIRHAVKLLGLKTEKKLFQEKERTGSNGERKRTHALLHSLLAVMILARPATNQGLIQPVRIFKLGDSLKTIRRRKKEREAKEFN